MLLILFESTSSIAIVDANNIDTIGVVNDDALVLLLVYFLHQSIYYNYNDITY